MTLNEFTVLAVIAGVGLIAIQIVGHLIEWLKSRKDRKGD